MYRPPTDAEGAIAFLWRRGKVPRWVNIHVYRVDRADGEFTDILLTYSGRFTSDSRYDDLYIAGEIIPPFSMKGPPLPGVSHISGERTGG
jgi:hypothetical protein